MPHVTVENCSTLPVYASTPMMSRFCVPTSQKSVAVTTSKELSRFEFTKKFLALASVSNTSPGSEDVEKQVMQSMTWEQGVEDVKNAKWVIMGCLALVFVLSLLYLFLLG